MKFSTLTAFLGALALHLLLLLLLVVNVSLDKPERPQDAGVKIMHATIVTPPAMGKETGTAQTVKTETQKQQSTAAEDRRKAAEEALKQRVEEQKKAEAQRALALKKKQEEQKKALEEQKRREAEAKAKAEAEAKALAEKKALEEAKKKAEEEAKRKALEEEAKRRAEEEARKLEAEAKAKAEAEAKAKAAAEAAALEEELLGTADGVSGGEGMGSGGGIVAEYGAKVQTLVEQNWRIDPSMNGKRVVVTLNVDDQGMISDEKCQGDKAVCDSALATLRLIGMLPMPPRDCPDCHAIVITMTPKL